MEIEYKYILPFKKADMNEEGIDAAIKDAATVERIQHLLHKYGGYVEERQHANN